MVAKKKINDFKRQLPLLYPFPFTPLPLSLPRRPTLGRFTRNPGL